MTAESRPVGSEPATAPIKTKWVFLILLVIFLGVIAWPVWDEGCPASLNVVRQEPSGILDLNDAEARLVYVSIVNDGGSWVLFNGMKVKAKVKGVWVEGMCASTLADLRPVANK